MPITLQPDGRRDAPPHLRTFRDGWRTLRFFLSTARAGSSSSRALLLDAARPRWLRRWRCRGSGSAGSTSTRTRCCSRSLAIICGYQSILFAFFTKIFAISEGLLPDDQRIERLFEHRQPRARARGGRRGTIAAGIALLGVAVNQWRVAAFGRARLRADHALGHPRRDAATLGFQTILSSFFVSILGMRRR